MEIPSTRIRFDRVTDSTFTSSQKKCTHDHTVRGAVKGFVEDRLRLWVSHIQAPLSIYRAQFSLPLGTTLMVRARSGGVAVDYEPQHPDVASNSSMQLLQQSYEGDGERLTIEKKKTRGGNGCVLPHVICRMLSYCKVYAAVGCSGLNRMT